MSPRDPARAPALWGGPVIPDTPYTPSPPQVSASAGVSGGASGPDAAARVPDPAPPPPAEAPEPEAPAPPAEPVEAGGAEVEPVRVGPGWGERLSGWAREAFVPPEFWAEDRPSLSKQLAYARQGAWGPEEGWVRVAAQAAFWGVSFPTSVAAYAVEWVGERPARWVVALVLISLAYQVPYVPEAVGVLARIPAWPITATWSALGLAGGN